MCKCHLFETKILSNDVLYYKALVYTTAAVLNGGVGVRGVFAPQGLLTNDWRHFWLSQLGFGDNPNGQL